jgi:hypothetical protein
MTPDVQSFESVAWLIVLVLATLAAAVGSETRRKAVEQREQPPEDEFPWWR